MEFIGENEMIGIIPNFTLDTIHLISGSIGPFRAGLPVHGELILLIRAVSTIFNSISFIVFSVPLWYAIHLRKQQKCRLVPPVWMDRDMLEEIKEAEKREK